MARILIVDDDPISLRILEAIIQDPERATVTAKNGAQALSLVRERAGSAA